MWWTQSWVERFFTDKFDADSEIPAAMKRTSTVSTCLAVMGAVEWIIALVVMGGGSAVHLQLGVLLGMIGSTAILAAVIKQRLELLIFVLLWDKRRERKDELRRLDAADL